MKTFCFTVDDNIRFLKDITENGHKGLFEHPYLAMYKRFHEEFHLKVQLNLFYQSEDFDLSRVSARFSEEWQANAHWLKLSFHSKTGKSMQYESATYDEVYGDCKKANDEIVRFASFPSLAKTTTIHNCVVSSDGLRALADNNISGLLGLFGTEEKKRISYGLDEKECKKLRNGQMVQSGGIHVGAIDVVLNKYSEEEILDMLGNLADRNHVWVMIHEQHYYADHEKYQPDFEQKLKATFAFLDAQGYKSCFFEDLI